MNKITSSDLRDYFYGKFTKDKEDRFKESIIANADNEEIDNELYSLLNELNTYDTQLSQRAFKDFCNNISTETKSNKKGVFELRIQRITKWTQRIAAILIIPIIMLSITMYQQAINTQEWIEINVPNGEKRFLELSDGSQLWLNSGTRITYPSKFGKHHRKIFIDGEVFADITSNPKSPFIISSGDVDVKVLGTEFNMRAYNSDPTIEVILIEGLVSFDVDTRLCRENIMMSPNDIVKYDRMTGQIEKNILLTRNYKAQACGGGFSFTDEKLSEIVIQLSRAFNKKIIIIDPELEDIEFFAFFSEQDSLDNILEILNPNGDMFINEHNNSIYISKK